MIIYYHIFLLLAYQFCTYFVSIEPKADERSSEPKEIKIKDGTLITGRLYTVKTHLASLPGKSY